MPIVPYVQDVEAYKRHFRNMDSNMDSTKKVHTVEPLHPEENEAQVVVKMVSPVQASIDRAKALLEKEKSKKEQTGVQTDEDRGQTTLLARRPKKKKGKAPWE